MAIYVGEIEKASKGYTQAGLNLLMSACVADIPVQIFPLMSPIRWDDQPRWADPLRVHLGKLGVPRDVALLHHSPSSMDAIPRPGEKKHVALTVIEADTLPTWIVELLNKRVDAAIVPSEFNREVFERCGVEVPVHVLPHSCGPWWWEGDAAGPVPGYEDSYIFYYIGSYNQRKNPEGALRAFLRAFPEPSPATIFAIKTGDDAGLPIRDAMEGRTVVPSAERIAHVIAEETGGAERPDVWVFTGEWSEAKIHWLHSIGDCCVSLHRGEGFGLVPMQAKLLGNPVIYTNWSSVPEFCSPEDGDRPVSYEMTTIRSMDVWAYPYFLGRHGEVLQWAEPDLEAASACMVECAGATSKGLSGERLSAYRDRFSWGTLGRRLGEILEAVRQ